MGDILKSLDEQQLRLGLPSVNIRALAPEEQDAKPCKKRNKSMHCYFQAAFFRREFFVALFGGPRPPPKPKYEGPKIVPRFQYDAGDGGSWKKWKNYKPEDEERIIQAFHAAGQKGRAAVTVCDWSYTFDFDEYQQIDRESGESWRIRQWEEVLQPGQQSELELALRGETPQQNQFVSFDAFTTTSPPSAVDRSVPLAVGHVGAKRTYEAEPAGASTKRPHVITAAPVVHTLKDCNEDKPWLKSTTAPSTGTMNLAKFCSKCDAMRLPLMGLMLCCNCGTTLK